MTEDSDSRQQGIDLGDLEDDLRAYDYPATVEELIETFGQRDIDVENGQKRFGAVLAPYLEETGGEDKVTFESADDVWNAVLNLVGSDAVGREGYSDRGDEPKEPDREEESF